VLFSGVACLALAGCEAEAETPLNTDNDVHCSGLSYYFFAKAQLDSFDEKEKRNFEILHHWYALEATNGDPDSPESRKMMNEKTKPVRSLIEGNVNKAFELWGKCGERAMANPRFHIFLEEYARSAR
jgi:hypothetical protein